MSKYEFKAINLIAETFEKHEAKFRVFNMQGHEELVAGFSVAGGPNVMMKFITSDNDNDVAARIFGLITKTPKEKRARVMEACNVLNREIRFMKFYLDNDGDINVEYDFPVHSSDECIGEMAFEIFVCTRHILDNEYEVFMKALYADGDGKECEDSNNVGDEDGEVCDDAGNDNPASTEEQTSFDAFLRMFSTSSSAEVVDSEDIA